MFSRCVRRSSISEDSLFDPRIVPYNVLELLEQSSPYFTLKIKRLAAFV